MINALPASVAKERERIEKAVGAWPIPFAVDHAIKWVLQFDSEDFPLALRILENIDVLAQRDLRGAFEIAQAKLERAAIEKGSPIKRSNTLYAGVGQASKSGALMAYHYRQTAEIAESDFFFIDEEEAIDFSKVENIVLLDDVIGTGGSVGKDVAQIAAEVHTLSKSRNIFVVTVAGYSNGISKVVEETGASVIAALEYSSKDTVTDFDAAFYAGLPMADRSETLERIKRYCRIASRSDLGYGGVGGLLVFDHNTPNTSLPVIWARGNGWIPLFPRAGRIHGSAKVLKVVEEERKEETTSQPQPAAHTPREDVEFTMFVEGKQDEIFVDALRSHRALASRLGVKDVNAVALGGLAQSKRLLELLSGSRKYAIFIVEGDTRSSAMVSRFAPEDMRRTFVLQPNFAKLLDVGRLYQDANRFRALPEMVEGEPPESWYFELEQAVFRRRPLSPLSVTQIFSEYVDERKYEEFVGALRSVVDRVLHDNGPEALA